MKKIISISILGILLGIVLYGVHIVLVTRALDTQTVLIARLDISPRTKLNVEMFEEVSVPNNELLPNYIQYSHQIDEMYSAHDSVIYEGSLIYHAMIENINIISDKSHLLLKENQSTFSLPIDVLKTAGNSIVDGQWVNLYVSIKPLNEDMVVDLLIEDIKVLAIKDRSGLDLNDINSTKLPYLINLAVNTDLIPLLIKANSLGIIELYVASDSYDADDESLLYEESKILEYLGY